MVDQSSYDTLYDRVFNLYGTNIDPQSWDYSQPDLTESMGEGWNTGDWHWDYLGTGEHELFGGSFDVKDWWRGTINAYHSTTGDPQEDFDWGEGGFETWWTTQMESGNYLDEDKYLGYWRPENYGEESLSKMEYRMGREGSVEAALKGSKKYQHGIGKKGFAGASKGGILGDSSMWDEFIQTSQEASRQFGKGQRGLRESWLDDLLSSTTMYG